MLDPFDRGYHDYWLLLPAERPVKPPIHLKDSSWQCWTKNQCFLRICILCNTSYLKSIRIICELLNLVIENELIWVVGIVSCSTCLGHKRCPASTRRPLHRRSNKKERRHINKVTKKKRNDTIKYLL